MQGQWYYLQQQWRQSRGLHVVALATRLHAQFLSRTERGRRSRLLRNPARRLSDDLGRGAGLACGKTQPGERWQAPVLRHDIVRVRIHRMDDCCVHGPRPLGVSDRMDDQGSSAVAILREARSSGRSAIPARPALPSRGHVPVSRQSCALAGRLSGGGETRQTGGIAGGGLSALRLGHNGIQAVVLRISVPEHVLRQGVPVASIQHPDGHCVRGALRARGRRAVSALHRLPDNGCEARAETLNSVSLEVGFCAGLLVALGDGALPYSDTHWRRPLPAVQILSGAISFLLHTGGCRYPADSWIAVHQSGGLVCEAARLRSRARGVCGVCLATRSVVEGGVWRWCAIGEGVRNSKSGDEGRTRSLASVPRCVAKADHRRRERRRSCAHVLRESHRLAWPQRLDRSAFARRPEGHEKPRGLRGGVVRAA